MISHFEAIESYCHCIDKHHPMRVQLNNLDGKTDELSSYECMVCSVNYYFNWADELQLVMDDYVTLYKR
jgi:hypothetical protein